MTDRLTLEVLAALGQAPTVTPDLLDRITERRGSGAGPALASFYRALKTGADNGWLVSATAEATDGPGRRPQILTLTPGGRTHLEREARGMILFAQDLLENPGGAS